MIAAMGALRRSSAVWLPYRLATGIRTVSGFILPQMKPANLFQNIPQQFPDEIAETLAAAGPVRIERIVSHGHCSPPGFWYDQEEHEWVLLLKGGASLRLADEAEPVHLAPGDYVNIPAHVRHRVESTRPGEDTVWLAVFYQAGTTSA